MLQRLKAQWVRNRVRARGGRPVRGYVEYQDVTPELRESGVRVEPYHVPREDFDGYVDKAGYASLSYYDHGRIPAALEKYLEHYVSLRMLDPRPGQVLIDIASMNSPFSEIAADLYDLETYRQDIMYPEGMQGRTIGGDAASMPIPDGFADHLVMHCSFEHFEGDSDSRFIREAERVLKPGGRLCILPLYTTSSYAIQTHPRGLKRQHLEFEPGDTVYVSDEWGPPHQRYYDAGAFMRRVVSHLRRLDLTIYRVTNLEEFGSDCYLRFAAVFQKPD
ncbi:MAG: methyltransferase domain-containing protein [Gemmatimonadota bacterium]|nr:methyltransferase domain-containing protein [Gemmatimonadota bacterium]MDH3424947.1 methyltransferase domain-containing protein [Gemmatimonadota bacterium]